jgi:hypothetical protein
LFCKTLNEIFRPGCGRDASGRGPQAGENTAGAGTGKEMYWFTAAIFQGILFNLVNFVRVFGWGKGIRLVDLLCELVKENWIYSASVCLFIFPKCFV